MSFLKKNWPLLTILGLGLTLRLLAITHYGDFWADEMFSFVYSQKPWGQSWRWWTLETNPPLHLFILKLWWYIFPPSELTARLPSLIFGLVSIAALYRFVKRIYSERIARVAALFITLSPYQIFLSCTARGYALLVLLTILFLDYFFRLFIEQKNTRQNAFYFSLVTLLLLYTHLTGLLLILNGGLIVAALAHRGQCKRWLLLQAIPLGLWLMWALPASYAKFTAPALGSAWFFNIQASPRAIIQALQPLFTGVSSWQHTLLIITLFFLTLGCSLYAQKKQNTVDKKMLTLAAFGLLPLFTALVLNLWNIKFMLTAAIALFVLFAVLVKTYVAKTYSLVFLLVGLYLPGLLAITHILPINNWQTVNSYLASRAASTERPLLIYNNFATILEINRYLTAPLQTVGYYIDTDELDYAIVTKNYIRFAHSQNEIEIWLTKTEIEKSYTDIFVLQDPGFGVDLGRALETRGWKLIEPPVYPRLLGNPTLLHYAKH